MSAALVTQLSAAEQSHIIWERREVQSKFADSLLHLQLVKQVGNASYGDKPMESLRELKRHDATFDTDIQSELHNIELRLRQQKLEQQWRKEGRGQDMYHADEPEAMEQWVKEQLEAGAASEVQLKLPSRKRDDKGKVSTLENRNEDYEQQLQARRAKVVKSTGDRVAYEGRQGIVRKNVNGICDVKWDKVGEDGEESAKIPGDELFLISKAHPAMVITADNQKINWATAKWRHKSNAVSALASLFSHYDGSSPDFLNPRENSRRAQVDKVQRDRHSRMMKSKPKPATPKLGPRKIQVSSKFMERPPFATPGAKERQTVKSAGEPLGLVFDPDTMCLTEAPEGTPAAAFDEFRGMRITHVSLREDYQPFGTDEGVHSKEQLRKALTRAVASETVAIRFEPWTQRRAVEKKKREFREKLISTKDKAIREQRGDK